MVDRINHTWYVSYEMTKAEKPPGTSGSRTTVTFPSQSEAREFARAKLAEGVGVSAGTINPHVPKRTIASTEIHRWLEEK